MPKIASSTIEEVNAHIDMVALVGEYTRLEKKGGDYWGCCPFHHEKTPSFHVLPDKKMCHCFGCGKGGTAISFYMEMEKVSFVDAILALAKKAGVQVVYENGISSVNDSYNSKKNEYIELYDRVSGSFHYFLTETDAGKKALDYLLKRGLTTEIIKKFNLGYSPKDRYWLKNFLIKKNYSVEFLNESGLFSKKYPDIAFFSNRVMFPIYNRNSHVVAFGARLLEGEGPKYLNSGDLIQYKKGETLFAFNLAKSSIRTQKTVIFCEGYMDVIAYHQAGIDIAVAPLGTALTEDQIALIRPFVETVLLSFDSDGAGQKATYKAILLCKKQGLGVKIIQLGKEKDPADILLNNGAEVLTKVVNSAILDVDYLLNTLKQEYNINTPEGKTKAALAFFPYVDSLQSDIQKQSCLDRLCQDFNIKPEAVQIDFHNREKALQRSTLSTKLDTAQKRTSVELDAEVRAMLAVISNIDYFKLMRNELVVEDFESELAKDLFIILEEGFRDDSLTYDYILEKCSDEAVRNVIVNTVTSGEYTINKEQSVLDSIKLIRRNSLKRKRDCLVNKINHFNAITLDDNQKLTELLNEKMNIDFELANKKDAKE